eukprot:CFRG6615T1
MKSKKSCLSQLSLNGCQMDSSVAQNSQHIMSTILSPTEAESNLSSQKKKSKTVPICLPTQSCRSLSDGQQTPPKSPVKRFSVLNSPQIKRVEGFFKGRKSLSQVSQASQVTYSDEEFDESEDTHTSIPTRQAAGKATKISSIENTALLMAGLWNPLRSGFQFVKPTFPMAVADFEARPFLTCVIRNGIACCKVNSVMWRLSIMLLSQRSLIVFTMVRAEEIVGDLICVLRICKIKSCEVYVSKKSDDQMFTITMKDGKIHKFCVTAIWRRDEWVKDINMQLQAEKKDTDSHLRSLDMEKWTRTMSNVSANMVHAIDRPEFKDGIVVLLITLVKANSPPGHNVGSVVLSLNPQLGDKIVFCRNGTDEDLRIFLTSGCYVNVNFNEDVPQLSHIRLGGIVENNPSHTARFELTKLDTLTGDPSLVANAPSTSSPLMYKTYNDDDSNEDEREVDEMDGLVEEFKKVFPELDPITCTRFLQARQCNLSEALKFRHEYEDITLPWASLTNSEFVDVFRQGLFYFHGQCINGAPLIIIRFERLKLSALTPMKICQFIYHVTRKIDQTAPDFQRAAIIMDFHGFQYSKQVDFGFYTECAGTLSKMMVEVLDRVFCVNTPFTIRSVWVFIATFLGQDTIDKIKFLKSGKNESIQAFIDPKFIPISYGGTSPLEIAREESQAMTADRIHWGWIGENMEEHIEGANAIDQAALEDVQVL